MKNDQRNIYFLELFVEPTSRKVNLNIDMRDIIATFEQCLADDNNKCDINNGTETLILRDILRSDDDVHCTLLIGLTNPKSQDPIYTSPDFTQRRIGKNVGEVGEIGCHVVIKMTANDVTQQTYSVLLEEVPGLNRSLVCRLLSKLLANEHKRQGHRLFEAPDNSGAREGGRPKQIGYRPKLTLTGIPSQEFIDSIQNGNISKITLMRTLVQTPFGQQAFLIPKEHTFEFSVDKATAPPNLWNTLKTALRGQRADWSSAKIKFEDDLGHSGTAYIESATGNFLKNSFTKRVPLVDIDPPLADSASNVVTHLSDEIIGLF